MFAITTLVSAAVVAGSTVAISGSTSVSAANSGIAFAGRTPSRLADTRSGSPRGVLHSEEVLRIDVGTSAPTALNTVAVNATGPGYLTWYPCEGLRPATSSINLAPEGIVANEAIVTPNASGEACLYARIGGGGTVDVVVDSYGFFRSSFVEQQPTRLVDTRRSTRSTKLNGAADLKVGVGVSHRPVALNVTAAAPEANGHVTVYPCDRPRPVASSINFVSGETRAGFVLVDAGDGNVCIHASAAAHIIVDKVGSIEPGPNNAFDNPQRVMDTRLNFNGRRGTEFSIDLTTVRSQTGQTLEARGRAVSLSITMVDPTDSAHVTVYPCSAGRPQDVSAVNAAGGRPATANSVIITPDPDNKVCFYSNASVDLLVDVTGFLNLPGDGPIYCAQMAGSLATANRWRAERGVPDLVFDEAAFRGAVWWATRLLETKSFRHSTPAELGDAGFTGWGAEVLSTSNDMGLWRESPTHYDAITWSQIRRGAFAWCYYTSGSGVTHSRAVGWLY